MSDLKHELLRIASDLPQGDPARREILAVLSREAGSQDVLWQLLDRRAFIKLYREMEKAGDQQSADLLREISSKLGKALSLSNNEEQALNRLRNSVDSAGRWDAALQRNNIFKAANLLGIKLPSAMFASDQSKEAGTLRYEGNTALDKWYGVSDLMSEVKRTLPPESRDVKRKIDALRKQVWALESDIKKAQG